MREDPLSMVEQIRRHKSGLSAKQLAEIIGCSTQTIHERAKAGKIPNYKVGGNVVFDPVETAAWLERCKVA